MMRIRFLALAALCCLFPLLVTAAETPPDIRTISVDQIQPGMKGVAYTVLQGTKPEPMDLEVLRVMKNMNRPKGDISLFRLKGKNVAYAGLVAGMSDSPVDLEE